MSDETTESMIIIGGACAGYTAALYAARADLKPLVFEGFAWGGQLQMTTDVENYPGYRDGVQGPDMMEEFRDQAERFGSRIISQDVTRVELSSDGSPHRVFVKDDEYSTRTLVLAMGANPRKLGVPGEEELSAQGVSYCATCDAAFFREMPTIVVGGGDSAMEEAIFLSKFASEVTVVHRRDEFRASSIMVERAREIDNLEFLTPYVVDSFEGNGALSGARLRHAENGEERELEIQGAFVAIGHDPNSGLVEGQVEMDEDGYVLVHYPSMATNVPGVFAAGDVVDNTYRQAVTAAGMGCQAALDAQWWMRDNPPEPEEQWGGEEEAEAAEEEAEEEAGRPGAEAATA